MQKMSFHRQTRYVGLPNRLRPIPPAAKIIGGQYSKSEYNASFVGFLPSRQPALTIIVVIDSPHGKGYTGGVVAAPIFKRIAEASLRHLGIAPTVNPMPPVLAARHERGAEPAVQRDRAVHPGALAALLAPAEPAARRTRAIRRATTRRPFARTGRASSVQPMPRGARATGRSSARAASGC